MNKSSAEAVAHANEWFMAAPRPSIREWFHGDPQHVNRAADELRLTKFTVVFVGAAGATAPADDDAIREQFNELATKWIQETAHLSVTEDIALHPSYQRIIGLGERALPFIFQDFAKRPRRWFWALNAITGADPTTPDMAGDVPRIAEAWRSWGRAHGWLD